MIRKITCTICLAILSTACWAQNITLDNFASGFDDPIDLKNAGDDRLFVVEQGGLIKIVDAAGNTNSTPFIDISSITSSGGEAGLLGLAFHPDYATNGFFFLNYSNLSGDNQISRFSVSTADPDVADPNSELPLITIVQPFSNHNGGAIEFGPDGYLYISSGDGGSGGDPGNRAQNTELLLGKMLRIDVDNPAAGSNYGIPADNPFAGDPSSAQEIWAYGLRNAWKFSFDRTDNDIWIADVGQNAIEEVNQAPVADAGLNYGWRCYEGSTIFNNAGCPPSTTLTFPVAEYNHSLGFSITGGYVYRGTLYSNFEGYYFYADFGTGLIGTVDPSGVQNNLGTFGGSWSTFGEDNNNELYIVSYQGTIFKIVEDVIASVDDANQIDANMYPNPARNRLNIELKDAIINSISIVDLKGSVLLKESQHKTSKVTLNTSALSAGIYFVKIDSEKGIATKKLIIK